MTTVDSNKFNSSETHECCNDFGHALNELTHLVSCASDQDERYDCHHLLLLLEGKFEELSMRVAHDDSK